MKQNKKEKWQKALKHWDKWNSSISNARTKVENKYGDIAELMTQATMDLNNLGKHIAIEKNITFIVSDAMEVVWKIDGQLEKVATRFISKEIGLDKYPALYEIFKHQWMEQAFPEYRGHSDADLYWEEAPYDILQKITYGSQCVKVGDQYMVMNSISWYDGQLTLPDIIKRLHKIKWPFDAEKVLATGKGLGTRLSKLDILYPEAVVCLLLNKKQKCKQAAIAKLFGWKTHRDSYGNFMSNTVRSRIKLGGKLLVRS